MPDRSLTYSRAGGPKIPSQPVFFQRLDEILEALGEIDSSHLDRHSSRIATGAAIPSGRRMRTTGGRSPVETRGASRPIRGSWIASPPTFVARATATTKTVSLRPRAAFCGGAALSAFREASLLLDPSHADTSRLDGVRYMNAGWTKVYALMLDGFPGRESHPSAAPSGSRRARRASGQRCRDAHPIATAHPLLLPNCVRCGGVGGACETCDTCIATSTQENRHDRCFPPLAR